jgi:P-type Mg2+ transporter
MEPAISASLVVLVVRTRQSILHSKPGKYLLSVTLVTIALALIIPVTPLASLMVFIRVSYPLY